MLEVHLPGDFTAGTEFVTVGSLDPQTGGEGSVQLQVLTTRPKQDAGPAADLRDGDHGERPLDFKQPSTFPGDADRRE